MIVAVDDGVVGLPRTVNNMRQNITVALATVTLLLLGVLFGGVTMAIGMLVHEGSVLLVILNAMRLLRRRGSAHAAPTALPVVAATRRLPEHAA